jgi:hypothetical protein
MAASTRAQLTTEVNTNFPDNTTGQITPAITRTTFGDFIASFATLADVNTFAPASGVAITVTGPANTNTAAINVTQSGPTSGTVAGPVNLNLINVTSYNAAVTGTKFTDFGEWSSALSAFRVNFTAGGANIGTTEPIIGILGHVRMTTATTTSVTTDYEGVAGISYINAASSGSGTTHEGVVGAIVADASANVLSVAGVFAEADIINGGTVVARSGLTIDSEGTGRATGDDAMIGLSAINNTGNYKTGILFSTKGGGQPVMSTGDWMASAGASSGAFTLANFYNLPNMTVTGQLFNFQKFTVRGTDGFTNIGNAVTPDCLLTVNGNTVAVPAAVSATTYLHVIGADAALARITLDAFANIPFFNMRRTSGTAASPTATAVNDFIGGFSGSGFQGGGAYATGGGVLIFQATENYSSGHNGTQILVQTTPNATGAAATAMTVQASGGISVGAATDPGIGGILFNAQLFGPNIATTASAANAFIDTTTTPVGQLKRSTSSMVYKRNVEPLDSAIAIRVLSDAKPIWYRSTISTDRQDWSWYGFGAEDMAQVEPRLVHFGYQDDDFEEIPPTIVIGPDGNETTVNHGKRLKPGAALKPDGVQYERLTAHLVAGWQQHEARIAALESRR